MRDCSPAATCAAVARTACAATAIWRCAISIKLCTVIGSYVSFAIQSSSHRATQRAASRHRRLAWRRKQRPRQSISSPGAVAGSTGSTTSSLSSCRTRSACAPGEHRSRKTRLPGRCTGVACPTAACGDRHPRRGPVLRTGSDRSGGQDRERTACHAATERWDYDCRFCLSPVCSRTRSIRDRTRFPRRDSVREGPLLMSALLARPRLSRPDGRDGASYRRGARGRLRSRGFFVKF
jgi:hypothetical protein